MNYYPFHIGDYVSATRHLSWEEDAAFRRLLDTYYTTEKPIPSDLRAACRLVMAQTDGQREAVALVLAEFFTMTDAGWVNKRADEEIVVMRDKQQKQRDKANKRWHKPEAEPGIAAASKTDAAASKTDADAMPPTPTPTPTPTPDKDIPARERAAAARLVSVSELVAEGVEQQCAEDWLAARKAKSLPLTVTAWKQTKEEAAAAGMSIGAAIKTAAGNGWAGFKAKWLDEKPVGRRPAEAVTVASDEANKSAAYLAEQAEHARKAVAPPENIRALVRGIGRIA